MIFFIYFFVYKKNLLTREVINVEDKFPSITKKNQNLNMKSNENVLDPQATLKICTKGEWEVLEFFSVLILKGLQL